MGAIPGRRGIPVVLVEATWAELLTPGTREIPEVREICQLSLLTI